MITPEMERDALKLLLDRAHAMISGLEAELERRTAWSNEQMAQLREERDAWVDRCDRLKRELAEANKSAADARAAHERTRAELERANRIHAEAIAAAESDFRKQRFTYDCSLATAQARVAELTRELEHWQTTPLGRLEAAEAALASARKLLERSCRFILDQPHDCGLGLRLDIAVALAATRTPAPSEPVAVTEAQAVLHRVLALLLDRNARDEWKIENAKRAIKDYLLEPE